MKNIAAIDLHMHSNYSDGVWSPEEVMRNAQERGMELVALTDHDTVAGVARAQEAARALGITCVSGIEISAQWRHHTIHILGLGVDTDHAELSQLLDGIGKDRQARGLEILTKLQKREIPITHDWLEQHKQISIGRMHFARELVRLGIVSKTQKAFQQFLGKGKSAFVKSIWPELEAVVAAIKTAGGYAIIAHPRRYKMTMKKLTELVLEFKSYGGDGLEVATASQTKDDAILLASLARTHDLFVSKGSDFHEPCPYNYIGKTGEVPPGCEGVWEMLD